MAEVIDALELIGPTAFGSSEEYARFLKVLDALRPAPEPDYPAQDAQTAPAFPYPAQR